MVGKIYSNDHLRRISVLDEKLKELSKILDDGEYLVAGIEIEINVGANSDRKPFTIDLGLSACPGSILQEVMTVMTNTRSWYLKEAMKDLEDLKSFFETCKP